MNEKIKASHDLLSVVNTFLKGSNEVVTTAAISEKVTMISALKPEWQNDANHEWVVNELIRRHQIWTSKETTLCDETDHEKWLVPSLKQDWRFWHRYRTWQEKKMPLKSVESLDNSTDKILGLLENPKRQGSWDRRGLVVGHVQSGKTGNYTGLICKAADAGYKIIIVLAGMHNNLRSQTQIRLDEGFLGYETGPDRDRFKVIGVGEIDPTIRPNFVTTRLDSGDFKIHIATSLGITPEERPWLFVVKKNKSILESLLNWLKTHVADTYDHERGEKVVTKLPLLMIDDEADNASVDTGELDFFDDGTPDNEHEPKTINRLIRRVLHTFTRKAYVGYTATPFANIFIHKKASTLTEGPDLFPSAFIINLGAPSNYIGPAKLFGKPDINGRTGGIPLIKEVSDHCTSDGQGWMPSKHKNNYFPPDQIPDTLQEAIDSFFIACAVRKLRGQDHLHSSMLVHVTRFNNVQKLVTEQIRSVVGEMRQRLTRQIGHEDVISRLNKLWEQDFLLLRTVVAESGHDVLPEEPERWADIQNLLSEVSQEIDVREINGRAKEALDYADSSVGLKVIAIGGDKLSRGLTLEGLCTSYFLRASQMYDTLMQMGRWFGYRSGYLDLCRLYTTSDLVEWFEHITDASEELREEFEIMADSGSNPDQYGLKVQSHSSLMITSPLKMRQAKKLYLSFSGAIQETVSFVKNSGVIKKNKEALELLVNQLPTASKIPDKKFGEKSIRWNGVYWKNVDWNLVTEFLDGYETHPEARKTNSKMLSDFITRMAQKQELTRWTIAVMNGGVKDNQFSIGDLHINPVIRDFKDKTDRFSIGRLVSPKDEAIDLAEHTWSVAIEQTRKHKQSENPSGESIDFPSGKSIRYAKSVAPEKGLLLFYLIDSPTGDIPLVGFAISFPGSNQDVKVEYKVDLTYWEEHGLGN